MEVEVREDGAAFQERKQLMQRPEAGGRLAD